MTCDLCDKPATCRGMEKGTHLCYTHSFEAVNQARSEYYSFKKEVKNGMGDRNVERRWSS